MSKQVTEPKFLMGVGTVNEDRMSEDLLEITYSIFEKKPANIQLVVQKIVDDAKKLPDFQTKDFDHKFDVGQVSDGYHTFNELYEFRSALTAALFRMICREWTGNVNPIRKSKLHNDGTMYEGYFIVWAYGLPKFQPSSMIDFHYPMEMWDVFDFAEEHEKAPPYDGHTSEDVLLRIKDFARMGKR